MSAGAVLQAAVVAALRAGGGLAALTQVADAPPLRAALPYAQVDDPVLVDWSTKDWTGREGQLAVTLLDAGERPTRLRVLGEAAEAAVLALDGELGGGWRIATLQLVRSRVTRRGREQWQATSEFRVRLWRADA